MIQVIILIVLFAVFITGIRWMVKRKRVSDQLNRREGLEIDLEVEELKAENDFLASTIEEKEED